MFTDYHCLVLLNCFPLFLHFLASLIKLILWLKFFHRQKADRGRRGKDNRVLCCCLSPGQLVATSWTTVCQAPLSMRPPRQEYCCGLPFPSAGDLSRPRDQTCVSCIAGQFSVVLSHQGSLSSVLFHFKTTCHTGS